jgi:tetratricopeptide (TPR) repeat protein
VATLDWLAYQGVSSGRDEALRRLLARLDTQTAERIGDSGESQRIRNLRTLATARGGMTVDTYSEIVDSSSFPAGLLPGVFDDFRGLQLEELLNGVMPDILGELYVLDRLAAGGVERAAARRLLRATWQASPDAYSAFVERAAADYREHAELVDLLGVCDWDSSPVACARMAADIIPLLRRSDHPVLEWIFARFESARETTGNAEMEEIAATARFRFANLVLGEGDLRWANQLYTEILETCMPEWPSFAGAHNNRGIITLRDNRPDLAAADFTAVIDAAAATDEARACSLNNRADIYDEDGRPALAIADRTALLNLAQTTYDRRFIALARRARALRGIGDYEAALRDIAAILETPDIAVEQKMNARLMRAQWLIADGTPADAAADLRLIAGSARNFDQVQEQALSLLAKIRRDVPE